MQVVLITADERELADGSHRLLCALRSLGHEPGEAQLPFASNFRDANDYLGLEISEPMIEAARG